MVRVDVCIAVALLVGITQGIPLSSKSYQDDGEVFPWNNNVITDVEESGAAVAIPETLNLKTEGEMPGEDVAATMSPTEMAKRKLIQEVRAKDEQIAQLTEDIEARKSEESLVGRDLSQLTAAKSKKAREEKAEHDSQIGELASTEAERLASVKRELALKVKHIRVDQEAQLALDKKQMLGETEQKVIVLEKSEDAIRSQLQEAKLAANVTDMEAEKVFEEHRQQWKIKHAQEIQKKGIATELKKVEMATSELEEKFKALEKRKIESKDHLKKAVQGKLLLAAQLKNLHAREEKIEKDKTELSKSNGRLEHELDEVRLTQESNAPAMSAALKEAKQSKLKIIETAKAEAEIKEEAFKKTTLAKAQEEIAELKEQLDRHKVHEDRAQAELLSQETSVQAELKQADDALAKVNWDVKVAKEQKSLELKAARDRSIDIVDEARKKAAALREHARNKGMKDASAEYQATLKQQAVEEEKLVEEQKGVDLLKVEFEEKTKHSIAEKEQKMRETVDSKRRSMEADLEEAAREKVQAFEAQKVNELTDIKTKQRAAVALVESAEKETRQLHQQELLLNKQQKFVRKSMVKDKAEWTYKQVMSNKF